MIRTKIGLLALGATFVVALTACSGRHAPSGNTQTSTESSGSTGTASAAGLPRAGAPRVQNPLPDKVLAGNPCDTALTAAQLSDYLGQSRTPKSDDSVLGPDCNWGNLDTGVVLEIGYDTKSSEGISLAYETEKSQAKRWVELDPIEGHPVVGYATMYIVPSQPKRNCVVVVGVNDKLAFSVSLGLGNKGGEEGDDACQLGRTVASGVLTNLKALA